MQTIRLALALRRSSAERFVTELGIHDYAREHPEIEIICKDGSHSLSWEDALASEPDALIGYFHQPWHIERVRERSLPAVCINSVFDHTETSCVRVDSYAVGVMAAEYFLELGCKDFTYITDVSQHYYSCQRQDGFCDHLKKHGHHAECISSESLEPAALWLQKKMSSDPLSGVFCVNDRNARALLNLLEPANANLEDSLVVLGVDNDPFYYENGAVIFSSIDVNHRHVGYLAAKTLHQRYLDHALPPSCTEVPPLQLHQRYQLARKLQNQHPALGLVFQKINADFADASLTAEVVAKHCGLSVRSLNRILKDHGHAPLAANILDARVRAAKKLLERSNLTLEQIAYTVGFNEYTTFYRSFKKSIGTAPSAFR
ncbi:helix-turn-helix domain-containing protein [Verrucomicrobiaceae bacterium R5-34]|uniref:Helix-turn-helix domain-containing protein n=1 Tax=Oceaniferula flava TaxID=2800421 RepID=A0AAE2V8G9_9BACT|nr:helix-turn-helix domain-containing protein [Oceaniferula flavus]MBK1831020.1 helix-turn-helix domain-containing protein [Verrucomicrobiaceae bacterium R5-34]MBK1855537.1 helix-turn-helix domain-containing protein [Oceaniferula flavus]MBM1136843.1 helix-turn-helix domain-containing protein [Oceaniferula flavus]